MSSIWGNRMSISLFGESHGTAIGITVNGLPAGVEIDLDFVKSELCRRATGKNLLTTTRKEPDSVEIVSGFFKGKTTGSPLTAIIRNSDNRSKDYEKLKTQFRPSHADFTGYMRYNGHNDYRGGGHFSGRLTAPLVFAGAIAKQILAEKGIFVGSHIKSIKEINDISFSEETLTEAVFEKLSKKQVPFIDHNAEKLAVTQIHSAREQGDAVGGVIETAVIGLAAGIGNPFFNSVESQLSALLFSVPAVKGVEFGLGFDITKQLASEVNDAFYYQEGEVKTKTNRNGGILGGISSGMPIIHRVAIKPTASIFKEQATINIEKQENITLKIEGRHDPCIVLRAVVVVEAVTAIGILEFLVSEGKWI